jgi:3-vinyl bacteriochlorophyllide hydratase
MLVIALHLAYVYALFNDLLAPQSLMMLALCAYVAYFINAAQFLWKLRIARKEYEASQLKTTHNSTDIYSKGYAS